MIRQLLKNEAVHHWLLSGLVLCCLAVAVEGQKYFDRIREPYPTPPTLKENQTAPGVLWQATRAAAVGDAYNRASDAARTANRAALVKALNDLRELKAASRAEPLALTAAEEAVGEAGLLDSQAQKLKGAAAQTMQAKAAIRYREALSLSPRFNSQQPDLLNALGYFLAERGSTPVEFRDGERLTRRALRFYDGEIKSSGDDKEELASTLFSRANTRDSLAWALYRQGRFEEALREQKQAVFEATLSSKAVAEPRPIPAELYFHMGEIYRALKRIDDARQQYQKALEIEPDSMESQQALKQLPKTGETPSKTPRKDASGKSKGLPLPHVPDPNEDQPYDADPYHSEPGVPGVPKTGPLIARASL